MKFFSEEHQPISTDQTQKKEGCSCEVWVYGFIKYALGLNEDAVVRINKDDVLKKVLSGPELRVVWIDIKADNEFTVGSEAVYTFWRLWEAGKLADGSHVIFTDINISAPVWRDLKIYESCIFGSTYLLTFSNVLTPGVCPSQRGMLVK